MNEVDQAIDVINTVTNLMDETPEQTEERRKIQAERRESPKYQKKYVHSERQQAHIDAGMCESDFY